MLPPSEDFTAPGHGPDYRIGSMGRAQDEGWRRETPPTGEDGSIPDRRLTVAPSLNIDFDIEQAGWVRRESTLDLPIG